MQANVSAFLAAMGAMRLTPTERANIRSGLIAETAAIPHLTKKEQADVSADLHSFVQEFPHKFSQYPGRIAMAVLPEWNLLCHLQPFVVRVASQQEVQP